MAFCGYLKQSTATTIKLGPFVDDTDGKTAETALTLSQADIRLSKAGGDMAQKTESSSCTHDEIGIYDCALDTTDTGTLGRLSVMVHESGALPVRQDYFVVTANVFDSLASTDLLQVDVQQVSGSSADNFVGIKKGVAVSKFSFYMEDTSGNPATGKTVTVQVTKDGGAFATVSDTVTEISGGWYEVDLSASETNADVFGFKATAPGCKQRNITFITSG